MAVGRSSRTPFKHFVLNSHLGKVVGVLSRRTPKVRAVACPFLCVDLCAGDGVQNENHQASPMIIIKHLNWAWGQGIDCKAVFIEKDVNTYDSLCRNIEKIQRDIHFPYEILNADAKEYEVSRTHKNQAIFINCDPNDVHNMPFVDRLQSQLTEYTTYTVTLGCNVGGLKRLPRETREQWRKYVETLTKMASWHDAILTEVVRDNAQWAYLTRTPEVWADGFVDDCRRIGARMFPHGVECASYRLDRGSWDRMLKRLFLTKGEQEDAA